MLWLFLQYACKMKYMYTCHWVWGERDTNLQTTFSNRFSLMKICEFCLRFFKFPINTFPPLVQIMAWRRPGDKPLSETVMFILLTHICVTQRQWIKVNSQTSNQVMDTCTRTTPSCSLFKFLIYLWWNCTLKISFMKFESILNTTKVTTHN